jgi:nitrogen fixation/metabolism regulation signal transduction histidine kinase
MRLTTFTQSLAMGESVVSLAQQGKSELVDELADEITTLSRQRSLNVDKSQSLSMLLGQLLEDLPIAVAVFDSEYTMSYANRAAYQISDISLLQGASASDLGFAVENKHIKHPALTASWRCQSSYVNYMEQSGYLFTAIDISTELKQSEQAVQKNLVRVLSHELRNTLTPMSSMAETLLSMKDWDSAQIRTVLERIKARSDGLLMFVQRFAQVAKIPEPNKEYFDLEAVLEQTEVLLSENDSLSFQGQQTCYGDPQLLAQVLINLVKNAVESVENGGVNITVNYYQADNQQFLSVADDGAGFSNIDNAITPLFTTKAKGAGIGLAFVEAVLNKHNGKVKLSNQPDSGAKIELTWPLRAN